MKYIFWLKKNKNSIIFLIIAFVFFTAVLIRLYNINYNSPHNDEAAYVIVGRMGIYQWDWWTYSSSSWLGGAPFTYPSLTGMAYTIGGIIGSRILNIIFCMLAIDAVLLFTVKSAPIRTPYNYLAGLIAAIFIAFSPVSYYISRLATYDMPSFYFLFLSLVLLLISQKTETHIGKYYFFSSLMLILAFLTKYIIAIYIPPIMIYSYLRTRKLGDRYQFYWIRYFLMPIVLAIGIYIYFNFKTMFQFVQLSATKDKSQIFEIVHLLWLNDPFIWGFWAIGSIGLFIKKRFLFWFSLTFCAVIIIVPHLISQRALLTLEKQTFLTTAFLAPIAGIGITNLLLLINQRSSRIFCGSIAIYLLVLYCFISYHNSQRFNNAWENSDHMLSKLKQVVHANDKVLVQVGAAGILASYDKDFPPNTATFDWFEFRGKTGPKAYLEAVKEGYFNIIELESDKFHDELSQRQLNHEILANLTPNYKLTYSHGGYYIYERTL